LKEIVMKTLIIATILFVGMLLRPQTVPVGSNGEDISVVTSSGVVSANNATIEALRVDEMESARGAGIFECAGWVDQNGDKHGMCCLNLWLFRLCAEVNISDIERLVSSLL
jgi:hypothetical protein